MSSTMKPRVGEECVSLSFSFSFLSLSFFVHTEEGGDGEVEGGEGGIYYNKTHTRLAMPRYVMHPV